MTVERSNFGVSEVGKVIIIAMDNDGTCIDKATMESIGRLSADDFGEAKSQKADTSHQKHD